MAFSVILADRHNLFLRTFSKLMQSEFTDLSVLGEVDNFNELGTILGKAHPQELYHCPWLDYFHWQVRVIHSRPVLAGFPLPDFALESKV